MKRYIERNFNGNMEGTFTNSNTTMISKDDRLDFISVEDLSKFENKADLKFANDHIAAHRVAGAAQMLDLEHFTKLHAMEFYLKHWDGYAGNTNNTYIYNDLYCRRGARCERRQVQDDPVGYRPDLPTR